MNPMRWASASLSKRLMVWIIPVAFLGINALGTSAYFISRRHLLTNLRNEVKILGDEAALNAETFFTQRVHDLETIAESPLLGDYYNNRDFGLTQEAESYRREIEHYFLKFSGRVTGVYRRILFLDAAGRVICQVASDPNSASEALPDLSWLQEVRQAPAAAPVRFPVRNDPRFGPVVFCAKPIYDSGGRLKGAVALEFHLQKIADALRRVNVGQSGWAFLADAEGNFLLGTRPPAGEPGSEFLTAAADLPEMRWRISLGARLSDFWGPIKRVQRLTFAITLLCSIGVILLVYGRVQALTRPVRHLVEAAQRLERGDLSGRVADRSEGEIGTLSNAFNKMAARLQERTRDLETRLRQLTALRHLEETALQQLDENAILRNCLRLTANGFGFDRVALYWVDPAQKEIQLRQIYELETQELREPPPSLRALSGPQVALSETVRLRNARLVVDPDEAAGLSRNLGEGPAAGFHLLAPICGKDRVFGILAAGRHQNRRPLDNSDKEGLALFANALGLALENAILVQYLAESQARYRSVLENSPVAVIGLSQEQRVTTWNPGAAKIFGYSEDWVLGKPVTVLFSQELEREFKALLAEVMQKGAVRDYSIAGLAKDGKRLDLDLSWGGAHQDFWMNKEWTLVIRDVSQAKKLQQQIVRSEKLSAVGQLISCIAHELNNPLQAVIGYAQLIALESSGPPARSFRSSETARGRASGRPSAEDLQMIVDNAMRCRKIIDNLLLFVRHGDVEKRPIPIQQPILAALDLLQYKLTKSASIQVERRWPPQLPPVKADLQQIQQVFVNLINNACDALTGSWTGEKRVVIRASASAPDWVRVEVADSGPGIPLEIQSRLFEPFFTTKPEGRGTGLGLTVCQQIIEEHGGRFGFQSRVGEGTVFCVELPAAPRAADPEPAPKPAPPPVRGKTVLVVDDEPDVLAFLSKALRLDGNFPETASSFQEAAAKVSQKPYDLIVTDIRLGDGSGIHLYESWPGRSSHPRPPFIFLTGDVLNWTLGKTIEEKGIRVLYKPVELEAFQAAMSASALR